MSGEVALQQPLTSDTYTVDSVASHENAWLATEFTNTVDRGLPQPPTPQHSDCGRLREVAYPRIRKESRWPPP